MDVDDGAFRQSPDGRITVDTRPEFEVLIRGDLVDPRTRDAGVLDVDREGVDRPWLDSSAWLSVEDARVLAMQLQEAARLIEEREALDAQL